ncbi:MAG: SDR family oxidoreductase [Hyphomicrobiales bacterium]|uniref:SDR family oxidoreductase n=1 Tax=Rhabdaerophilum calidifontis TaxID=2604328 RepID=UPI00123B1D25|nr:SDR family oxidoreductase [Rhabdaerophilum calidifontis]MCA1951430.1 SDR family oxidoreductase [Hyphomicrobiales bacterium]
MDLGLKGRVALVTAASGGLGAAIAAELAAEGARVAISGTNPEKLEAIAGAIRSRGGVVLPLVWDLADLGRIEPAIAEIEAAFGPIEILVNNTGGPPPSPAAGQSQEVWRRHFEAMVLSVLAITDRVLPGMKAAGWGRIITCTSSGVIAPIPNLGISNTLRAALVGWSKTLSRELARDGITANILAPGRILTDRVRAIDANQARREGRTPEEVAAASAAAIPAGRYGDPAEFAAAAAFLASTRASYITGSTIRVDGGALPNV